MEQGGLALALGFLGQGKGILVEEDSGTDLVCYDLGICIGGIGVLCPEKRGTISRLIVKATLAGVFVSINSALLVSIVSLIPVF